MAKRCLTIGLFLLILLVGVLVSCTEEQPEGPTALPTPVVTLEGDVAKWEASPNATRFEISVNGELSYLEGTMTSKKLSDGESFKLRAIGDGKTYTDSAWSNAVVYVRTEYTITWKNGDEELKSESVAAGAMPSYTGEAPTKPSTAQYDYVFSGWNEQIVAACADATYTAKFDAVLRCYTVTWKNGDTKLTAQFAYGETPIYTGEAPTKPADARYTYEFRGWTPQVVAVTGDATYEAMFVERDVEYLVTWKNEEIILKTEKLKYGTLPTYIGETPRKASDAQYDYTFSGWSPVPSAIEGETVFVAQYTPTLRTYTVTWMNGNVVLETDNAVPYGRMPSYNGVAPVKLEDAQYVYEFSGWSPELSAVSGSITYVAQFKAQPRSYTVTWKNGDVELMKDTVEYGVVPTYKGEPPTKASDAQYDYIFSGWMPVVSAVSGDVTYMAQFATTLRTYTVTWKNGDTELEVDQNVIYGSVPVYNGETPVKQKDAQYTYVFSGWSPVLSLVTGNVTYVAQFSTVVNEYTVTFYNEDGSGVLATVKVPYGQSASYSGQTPVKEADRQYTYTFEKWVSAPGGDQEDDLSLVVADRVVYAAFLADVKMVSVQIKVDDEAYGTVSVAVLENIPFGSEIRIDGNVLTVAGKSVTATPSVENAQYHYFFEGFDAPVSVEEQTVITARFGRSLKQYTVTWMNGSTTLEVDNGVNYGETPVYDGITPTKPSDGQYTYVFSGWSPSVSPVTGDVTYVAQFADKTNKYTVNFYDENGSTLLGVCVVDYGATAEYPHAATPSKPSTVANVYVFDGWVTEKGGNAKASLEGITSDRAVYASYRAQLRTYDVRFVSGMAGYGSVSLDVLHDVPYGSEIVISGSNVTVAGRSATATPAAKTAQYAYSFVEWSAPATVGDQTVITATFKREVRSYTVTWKNGSTVLEVDRNVAYGTLPVYNGATPTKPADAQYTYTFGGWSPSVSSVKGDVTYTAQFVDKTNKYTVSFYDESGETLLGVCVVNYGMSASYPHAQMPAKQATVEHMYVFAGWVSAKNGSTAASLTSIVSDTSVYASFRAETRTYDVQVVVGSNAYGSVSLNVLENIPYGSEIKVNANSITVAGQSVTAIPLPATAQYTYAFAGWIAEQTTGSDTILVANFSRSVNTYTVSWKNGDTVLELDPGVAYGEMPVYNGEIPTKPADAQYTYVFSGWSPVLESITGDVVYTAQFTGEINKYTVKFYDETGSNLLGACVVNYGADASYPHAEAPTKSATAAYTYTFSTWVSEPNGNTAASLANVVSDRNVYASYQAVLRCYDVKIVTGTAGYGNVSVNELKNIPFGSEIQMTGNTLVVAGQSVVATPATATAQYTYSFAGWSATETTGSDTVIVANFSRSVNGYTVTWKNGDTVLESDENVPYGTVPVYNGAIPTKPSDAANVYTFSGWSPSVCAVTGNATYQAAFTNAANKHTVTFYDEDGTTVLGIVVVDYGADAVYPNAQPTKSPTAQTVYTFDKWVSAPGGSTEAALSAISGPLSVYAKYQESARTYTVAFVDEDGTMLQTSEVEYGGKPEVPEEPEREGYRFDHWEGDFDCITADTVVRAVYQKQYCVTFFNYDGSVLSEQWVDEGLDAKEPTHPERNNYRFVGWDGAFVKVSQSLSIQAVYKRQYKVTFLAQGNQVQKQVKVDEGTLLGSIDRTDVQTAMQGYDFLGWDKADDFEVRADLTVTAQYKIKTYTVTFKMPNGEVIGKDTVEHGFSAIAPAPPAFCVKETSTFFEVKGFTTWDKELENITADTVITAVYDSEYKDFVVIIDVDTVKKEATVYFSMGEGVCLYAIEFTVEYSVPSAYGKIGVESVTTTSSDIFAIENDNSEKCSYVNNNNEKKFTLAWSNTNGEEFTLNSAMTFHLSTGGDPAVIEECFRMVECKVVIGDAAAENTTQISAIIVYR